MKVCSYCYRTDPNHTFDCPEYLKKARKDAEVMKQLLLDLYEYLDNRADVDDNQPNNAMKLQMRVEEAMNDLEEQ